MEDNNVKVLCIEDVDVIAVGIAFIKGKHYEVNDVINEVYFITNEQGYEHELTKNFFNKHFVIAKPVDLSTVKVGEKYVIGEISEYSSKAYVYENEYGSWANSYYKAGDIIHIVEGLAMEICFSKAIDEDESDEISMLTVALYPYTHQLEDLSEPLQADKTLMLGVTPENENIDSEGEYTIARPTSSLIDYAKKTYEGYLAVARVFRNYIKSFSELIDSGLVDENEILENSLWWVDDAMQERLLKILGIDYDKLDLDTQDEVLDVLTDSFKDMDDFDILIGRLRLRNIVE